MPMRYFDRFQPRSAWADLRYFLQRREPYQLWFFALSIALTVTTIAAFVIDSRFEPEYHRDIVYVQQWPLSRTDKQIIADQKVDYVIKARRLAAEKRAREANQAGFQKIQDKLDAWGIK